MAKFRKKSLEVEAVQYAGDTTELPYEMGTAITRSTKGGSCFVDTPNGIRECRVEDWILRDSDGDFQVWSTSDLFAVYEPLDKYPDCPTVEIDIAGAVFDIESLNLVNDQVDALTPRPESINLLIRRLYVGRQPREEYAKSATQPEA